jgi:hypothetical protein
MAREAKPVRRALLVCNGTFDDDKISNLAGVNDDSERMRTALSNPRAGFDVTPLLDAGFLEVRKAIARLCAESGPDDTILLYYSGASFRGQDGSLFLPVRDSSAEYADATTIDTDFILRNLRHGQCKRNILLVDGCHAGAFFVNNRGIPDGLYAIMACAADEMTADTSVGGAFTCALVAALDDGRTDRDGDGLISIDELFDATKRRLAEAKYQSTPQKWIWNVRDAIYVAQTAPSVFVSYAREDVALAQDLQKKLEACGFAVWVDLERIRAGNWVETVIAGLNRSRCVVFLMTKDGLDSAAVRQELEFATQKRVPLIPVSVKDWAAEELPDWFVFQFRLTHRHLLTDDASIQRLAVAIRSVTPG